MKTLTCGSFFVIIRSVNTPPLLSPEEDIAKNKEVAAVSYTLVLAPILLFGRKESSFIQFHAKQGSVLLVIAVLFWVIPFVGRFLELIIVGLAVAGFFHASQGKRYELPFIYAILQKDLGSNRLKIEWARVEGFLKKLFPHHDAQSTDSKASSQPSQEPEKRYDFPHIQKP